MGKALNIYPKHPAVASLVKLQADLAGRIQQNQQEGERLQEEVRHVEATIKLFDPDFNLQEIRCADPRVPDIEPECPVYVMARGLEVGVETVYGECLNYNSGHLPLTGC